LNVVEVKGTVKAETDAAYWTSFGSVLGVAFQGLFEFLNKYSQKVFRIMPAKEHYTTPQLVVLADSKTGRPVSLKDLFSNDHQTVVQVAGSRGGSSSSTSGGALEATQLLLLAKLEEIKESTDNIEIDAESVNLNTDQLEALLSDTITAIGDSLEQYKPSDLDEADANTKYYGFIDKAGNWYIMKVTASAIRYVKGTTGYDTAVTGAWATRASQTYDYFNNVF
jgi:hypothetical protein